MNMGRGFGAPGEALLVEHPFLCTLSRQTIPCTVFDLGGLNLSYLWAEKMPPAARMPLVHVQMGKDMVQASCYRVHLMRDACLW